MTASTTEAARAGQAPSPAGWSRAPDLPIRVQEIYPAVMGGRIYVTGGLSPDMVPEQLNISDRVFSWAPGEASWREEPRLPLPIHHPYGLEREGKLFAIGGFTAREGGRWSMSEVVHLLDPQTGGWRFGRPLAMSTQAHCVRARSTSRARPPPGRCDSRATS